MQTATPNAGGPQQLLACVKKHRSKFSVSKLLAPEATLQQITAPQNKHTQSSFFLIDDSEQIQQLERLCSHTNS
jgi:hypothetical protein